MVEYANGLVMLEGDKRMKEATKLYEDAAAGASRWTRWSGWTWRWRRRSWRTERPRVPWLARRSCFRHLPRPGMFSHIFIGVSDFERAFVRDTKGNKICVASHGAE